LGRVEGIAKFGGDLCITFFTYFVSKFDCDLGTGLDSEAARLGEDAGGVEKGTMLFAIEGVAGKKIVGCISGVANIVGIAGVTWSSASTGIECFASSKHEYFSMLHPARAFLRLLSS